MRELVKKGFGLVGLTLAFTMLFGMSVMAKARPTIENVKDYYAVECDVVLKGSGSGYHAKIVMGTDTAAVSYGLQYDKHAVAPYTGKTAMLVENIRSNAAGGQSYSRPGGKTVKLGKKYHLMMTMDEKGNGSVYLDYKKLGTFSNKELAKKAITMRIEGAARVNGDTVDATFTNLKLKAGKKYNKKQGWGFNFWDTSYNGTYNKNSSSNTGAKIEKKTKIRIKGTVKLDGGKNWDDPGAFDHVSGVLQFFAR